MNGLILVGGQSTRMGADKSLLSYHAKPQWEYLLELLANNVGPTYLSCRGYQQRYFGNTPVLVDQWEVGPLGGIWSAFLHKPTEPWCIVACDMPFITLQTITYLLNHRNEQQAVTVFEHPSTRFLEPLVGIWEPTVLSWVSQAMSEGAYSPTKLLQKMGIQGVPCPDERWLRNINTPDEREEVKRQDF